MTSTIQLSSECSILTYKDGLLSRVAHNLKLRVETHAFEWEPENRTLRASFDIDSIRVVCARVNEQDTPSLLSMRDKEKIEQSIREDVLLSRKHPKAYIEGKLLVQGDSAQFEGELTLRGVTRPLRVGAARSGVWHASVRLHQPDFGIKPFTAALGTLKVKPDVTVEVTIQDPEA